MPSIKAKGSRPAKPQIDPLRKLSFGAINRKANNAKTAYPVLPDPNGQLAIITARIIDRTAQIEALDGALAIDKSELKTLATPFYFIQASGKIDVASSVSAVSSAGEVLITFPNRYSRLESEAALLPILGERTTTFFRQAFALEIDGDKLPAEDAQELLEELQRLYALLQQSVDESLQQPGFRPGPNGNGNGHNQSWGCSEKQRGLILRLVQEHQLDKALVEQLSQDRFGKSLKSLTRLEASSLIEALIDKTGGSAKNQRRRFNDRGNPANAR